MARTGIGLSGTDEAQGGRVARAVEGRRASGDEALLVLGSDHGHETVTDIVPIEAALVSAGFKESGDSKDVVFASSGKSLRPN